VKFAPLTLFPFKICELVMNRIISVKYSHDIYDISPSISINKPLNWLDVQSEAIRLSKNRMALFNWRLIFSQKTIFLWSHPSIDLLALSILKKEIIFLCWGLPRESSNIAFNFLRYKKLKAILLNAKLVLVNDYLTLQELINFGVDKTRVILFPYVVDSQFFQFSNYSQRKEFLLVPGDNERDEGLVQELSLALPYKIVRITREQNNLQAYNLSKHKVELKYNISFLELRELYQRAAAIIIPLRTKNHASGQTSVLEAIACGAPVLISKGRASSIVNHFDSIFEVDDNQISTWNYAITSIIEKCRSKPQILEASAKLLTDKHNPRCVAEKLANLLVSL
jgi:glycosyltransferase involved in cell wall biosynthesis